MGSLIIGLALGAPAAYSADNANMDLDYILTGISSGRAKVDNFRAHAQLIRLSDPSWLVPRPPATQNDPRYIAGKEASVSECLIGYRKGKVYIDERRTAVTKDTLESRYVRNWYDGVTGHYFLQNPPDAGYFLHEFDQPSRLPLNLLTNMQLQGPAGSELGFGERFLRNSNVRAAGACEFSGMDCIRLDCGDASVAGSDSEGSWGHILVCPSKNYREVYSEWHDYYAHSVLNYKETITKFNVLSFGSYGGIWIPTLVRNELYQVGPDGKEKLVNEEVFRITKFEPNSVPDDGIFETRMPPETQVFNTGKRDTGLTGLDTSAIEEALGQGLFFMDGEDGAH